MSVSVEEARQQFSARRRKGTICPVCDRFGKEYSRPMRAGMALALIEIYKYFHGTDETRAWCHVESLIKEVAPHIRGGDWCKLRFWGFLEQPSEPEFDDLSLDGDEITNPKNGYWRITEAGEAFVRNQLHALERVVLYNNTAHGFEGELVDITTVLQRGGFNYEEIMQ